MPLLKAGAFVEDRWIWAAEGEPMPAKGAVIVPLARFLAEAEARGPFKGELGVVIDNTTRLEALEPVLEHVALVVLSFPAFTDGRAYSLARQIRLGGFRGELRAMGGVLPDQVQFMREVGFDSFMVGDRFPLEAWLSGAAQMSLAYQRGLYRKAHEVEIWTERHLDDARTKEPPHGH